MHLTECAPEISNVGWERDASDPPQPTLTIQVAESVDGLIDRLSGFDGDPLEAAAIDVTFRFQSGTSGTPIHGVLGVTNNITGGYVLEARVKTDDIDAFVTASRRYGDKTGEAPYRVQITHGEDVVREFEKRLLLVYDASGSLLRKKSIIPNNIEV